MDSTYMTFNVCSAVKCRDTMEQMKRSPLMMQSMQTALELVSGRVNGTMSRTDYDKKYAAFQKQINKNPIQKAHYKCVMSAAGCKSEAHALIKQMLGPNYKPTKSNIQRALKMSSDDMIQMIIDTQKQNANNTAKKNNLSKG